VAEAARSGVVSTENVMTTLSQVDPTVDIACTLPVTDVGGRLNVLQTLVGDHLGDLSRERDRLRIRILRAGRSDLEAEVAAFAEAEKACCAFLGFAVESTPETVTLEIATPIGAEPTLDGIEWLVRAAGRQGVA
jgi:hypothetical protein